MKSLRIHQVIEKDGELSITGLPYKKGQHVEVIVSPESSTSRPRLTAHQLLQSELIGLWRDRTDINDSSVFARQLREQAQKR